MPEKEDKEESETLMTANAQNTINDYSFSKPGLTTYGLLIPTNQPTTS